MSNDSDTRSSASEKIKNLELEQKEIENHNSRLRTLIEINKLKSIP